MCSGLEAEKLIILLLERNGKGVKGATDEEDMFLKVDLWLSVDKNWVPIQLSLNKKRIFGKKGKKVLDIGIVPMWIDAQELEAAVENGDGVGLVDEFYSRVKKILAAFPKLKRFSQACWDLRLEVK